jgi:hypothetical protein
MVEFLVKDMYDGVNLINYVQKELKNSKAGPEMLFEAIDRFGGMTDVINFSKAVNLGKPNVAHYALSALAHKGLVNHLVTTNWDTYLEKALGRNNSFQVISSNEDIENIKSNSKWLLHIHGSISSSFIQGGLYRLGYSLIPQIDGCLQTVLEQSDLLVIGYSGNDYDVFPSLRDHFGKCNNHLFWVYRENDKPGENLQILAKDFPDRVYLLAMDLYLALTRICDRLNITFEQNLESGIQSRSQTLNLAAKQLGHIGCYLVLSFLSASIGLWKHAMHIAEFATDAAYSKSLYPKGTPHDLASEAYRYAAACAACAHDYDYAEFLLRNAQSESNQPNKSFLEASKNIMALKLQESLICLCKGNTSDAESHLTEVLTAIRSERIWSRNAEWPMLNSAAVAAYVIILAISESDIKDATECNEVAYLAQIESRNILGSCASLLSLALCYYRKGLEDDALSALDDCISLANATGNIVCAKAAQVNINLIKYNNAPAPLEMAPVIDQNTGWHLMIDPFALFIRWKT